MSYCDRFLRLPLLALVLTSLLAACAGTDDLDSPSSDDRDSQPRGTMEPSHDGSDDEPQPSPSDDDGSSPLDDAAGVDDGGSDGGADDGGTDDGGTDDGGTDDGGTDDGGTDDGGTDDGGTDDGGTDDGGTDDGGTDDGGPDGGDPSPSDELTPPGGACSCDDDCQTIDGYDGICVYGICMSQASADCASAGSSDECPDGSRCWFLSQQPGPICWPDCDSFDCDGTCDSDGSCVFTEESDCSAACGSYCSPADVDEPDDGGGDDPVGGTIGAVCGADTDCGEGTYCVAEEDGNGWIDGYCFGWDCSTPGAACDDGGVCVAELGGEGVNTCMQPCEAGCREGYACMVFNEQTFCYPYCEANADCPDSYQCSDNACVPGEPCSASAPNGYCGVGEVCDGGSCQAECAADASSGWCPDGFTCDGGDCVSTSGCGTWQCTGSSCDDLVAFDGSYDPSSAQARADGYFITTAPQYAYMRGDLVQLFQWAACEMRAEFPGIAPLALSDMAQANGSTPGTDNGQPRHPTSTHRGTDIDTAYYQTDGANNYQIICGDGSDTNGNGFSGNFNDGYFCTTEANIVDVEQQVWFMALLANHPEWRVVGIDQTLADDFFAEIDALFEAGRISTTVRNRLYILGYGADGGWQFHHHHAHFSFN